MKNDETVLFVTDAGDNVIVRDCGSASSGDMFWEVVIPDMLTTSELKKLAIKLGMFADKEQRKQ